MPPVMDMARCSTVPTAMWLATMCCPPVISCPMPASPGIGAIDVMPAFL
jgi:hypothetical protein